jgi:hypothetical protein
MNLGFTLLELEFELRNGKKVLHCSFKEGKKYPGAYALRGRICS